MILIGEIEPFLVCRFISILKVGEFFILNIVVVFKPLDLIFGVDCNLI
jgi:hypothetical protein